MSSQQIALFTTTLGNGGAQRVMCHLAEGFIRKGLEVDFVLLRDGKKEYSIPDRVRVVDIGAPRIYAALPGLARYMRERRPDAMLSAGKAVNVMVLLARRLSMTSPRLVISEHSTLSNSIKESTDWRMKILPFLMDRLYDESEDIVAVSKGVATDLSETLSLEKEPKVIYNPVVTPDLHRQAGEKLSDTWFDSDAPPVVLSAGRLNKAKDFSTLITAFAQLRKQRQCRLVILGKGKKEEELKSLVEQHNIMDEVRFPGFVTNPYKYMKHATVFALSSKWEGLPTALIEAMACGTPVVSTDCPSGPAEILEDGKWGRLVPVGEPDRLCTAIADTLDDPINPEPRSADFQLENAVGSYLKLLDDSHTD